MKSLFLLQFYQKQQLYFGGSNEKENIYDYVLTKCFLEHKIKYIINVFNKV